MNLFIKINTGLGLLARGQWGMFDRQWRLHWRSWRLRQAGNRPFIHRTAGHPLVCFPDLPDSVSQYLYGGDDHWELSLLRRWLQPNDLFVDAGANLGLYTHAVAGRFGGRVRVLALEASPHLVQRIDAGIHRLGERNVQTVQVAVGAESGEVTFHLARPGCTTVSQSMRIDPGSASDYEAHTLPMRPLRELAANTDGRGVALVKLDVEGAEPLAIRGARLEWLAADGPLWLVEINLPVLARMGFGPSDVINAFPAANFEHWILPKYPLPGQPPARVRHYRPAEKFDDAQFHNFIAVPLGDAAASRRARIRALFP